MLMALQLKLFYPQTGLSFLAPTGAQGVTMSVRPSVRLAQYAQEQSRAVNLHLSRSESNQSAV